MEKAQRCRVTIPDANNREHVIEVTASTLYEAIGLAVQSIQEGDPDWNWNRNLGAFAKVEVYRPTDHYTVPLQQLHEWMTSAWKDADPNLIVRKNSIRQLLGMEPETRALRDAVQRR